MRPGEGVAEGRSPPRVTGQGTSNLGLQLCQAQPTNSESLKQKGAVGLWGSQAKILGPFLLQVRLRGPVGSAAVSPMNKFLDSVGGRVGGGPPGSSECLQQLGRGLVAPTSPGATQLHPTQGAQEPLSLPRSRTPSVTWPWAQPMLQPAGRPGHGGGQSRPAVGATAGSLVLIARPRPWPCAGCWLGVPAGRWALTKDGR